MQRITGDLRQLQGDANTAVSCQHRFWGAEGTQGAHRGHTDTCGHEEHLYPFLFSCCFTGALPDCAVFFPLPSCRHALVAAALCIRSRSSNDSSASSGRESDAHLSPAASHGASCPGGGDKRHDRSAAAPPRPPGSGKPPRLVAPRGSSLWRRSRPSAQPPAPSLAPLPPRAPQPPPSAGRSARTPFPQRSAASPGRTRRQTRCLTFRRRAHHLLPAAAPHTAPRRPPHGRPPPPPPRSGARAVRRKATQNGRLLVEERRAARVRRVRPGSFQRVAQETGQRQGGVRLRLAAGAGLCPGPGPGVGGGRRQAVGQGAELCGQQAEPLFRRGGGGRRRWGRAGRRRAVLPGAHVGRLLLPAARDAAVRGGTRGPGAAGSRRPRLPGSRRPPPPPPPRTLT